jgi:hypothetical protein
MKSKPPTPAALSLRSVGFSNSVAFRLASAGIVDVQRLQDTTDHELKSHRGISVKCLAEVRAFRKRVHGG